MITDYLCFLIKPWFCISLNLESTMFCTWIEMNQSLRHVTPSRLSYREYVSRRVGLSSEFSTTFNSAHKGRDHAARDKNRTETYFRQLTEQQRRGLADLYRVDFEMFGYDSSEFV